MITFTPKSSLTALCSPRFYRGAFSIACCLALAVGLGCSDATSPVAGNRGAPAQPRAALLIVAVPQVSLGRNHSCALKSSGRVVCWGDDGSGQSTVPAGLSTVTEVAAGGNHTCALRDNATVHCWGENNNGESTVPDGLLPVTEISSGNLNTCVLQNDATVICWGRDAEGQSTVPGGLADVVQISAGVAHTCAVKSDSTAVCWGGDSYGESTVPALLPPVSQIVAGDNHTCALKGDSTVTCWGDNTYTQLDVPGSLTGVVKISAGFGDTCALKATHRVVCWGTDPDGQTNVPTGLMHVTDLASGAGHNCAAKADGTVACWGYNGVGQTVVPAGLNVLVHRLPAATFRSPPAVEADSDIQLSLLNAHVMAYTGVATFKYSFDCGNGMGYHAYMVDSTFACHTSTPSTRFVRARVKDQDGDVTEYADTVVVQVFSSFCQYARVAGGKVRVTVGWSEASSRVTRVGIASGVTSEEQGLSPRTNGQWMRTLPYDPQSLPTYFLQGVTALGHQTVGLVPETTACSEIQA